MNSLHLFASKRKNRTARIGLMALAYAWDESDQFRQWAIGSMIMIPLMLILPPIFAQIPEIPLASTLFIYTWTGINVFLATTIYFIDLHYYRKRYSH